MYEVVWVRQFTLFTGHTALATSSVLSAYMAGLGLGAWLAGRLADRLPPSSLLRLYGAAELGIGLFGLLSRPLIELAGRLLLTESFLSAPAAAQSAAYFGTAFAILLAPTCLMGATLPLLTRWWSCRGGTADRPLSLLYGVNTLGAVTGAALAGFALVPAIGLWWTTLAAASLNALCAVLAWLACRTPEGALSRGAPPRPSGDEPGEGADALPMGERAPKEPKGPPGPAPGTRGSGIVPRALAVLALTGAGAMVCEVAWTRQFALVLGSTVYAFTTMLATFLLGLAAGSLAFHRLRARAAGRPSWLGLGLLLSAAAAAVYAGLPFFGRLPYLLLKLQGLAALGDAGFTAVQFTLCAIVTAGPTLLMGAALPWAVAAAAPAQDGVGREVGACYAANTLGSIAGSAGAGLFLLPLLGLEQSLLAAVWLYGAAAVLALGGACAPLLIRGRTLDLRRWAPAAVLAALGLLSALTPGWDPRVMSSGVFIYAPAYADVRSYGDFLRRLRRDELLFQENGANAMVSVHKTDIGFRYLRVNGKTDASEGQDMATQYLLGYLPLAFHPGTPRRALVVGLGIGVTAAALATEPGLDRIDVAEIEPAVARAARWFSATNRGVLDDPRLRMRFADARQLLAASGPPYDIITSEPSNPWIAGIASLYTREAFEASRARLAPGGVFCQWFHGYFMTEPDFRMVAKTFASVFPHAMLMSYGQADYFLMGSNEPWRVDYPKVVRMFERNRDFKDDMVRIQAGLDHPLAFLAWPLVNNDRDLRAYAGDAPVHTDDRPTLEFSAPRSFRVRASAAIHDALARNKRELFPDGLTDGPPDRSARAILFVLTANGLFESGDHAKAETALMAALSLDPRCGRAWVLLGRLREAQGRPDAALSSYIKGVQLEPSYTEGHHLLGKWFAEHGLLDNALRELDKALELTPGYPPAAVEAGLIHLVRGRPEEAGKLASSALSQTVVDIEVRKRLLYLAEKAGIPPP